MRFSTIIALAVSAVSVSAYGYHNGTANGTETTVTEVVTMYTTYCPLPTTIVENNQTYTVTEVCGSSQMENRNMNMNMSIG